jgi:hypothetical protein
MTSLSIDNHHIEVNLNHVTKIRIVFFYTHHYHRHDAMPFERKGRKGKQINNNPWVLTSS